MKNIILAAVLAAILAACAEIPPTSWTYWVRDDLSGGIPTEAERAGCEAEAASVTGYDRIDTSLRQREAFNLCMRDLGYVPRRQ